MKIKITDKEIGSNISNMKYNDKVTILVNDKVLFMGKLIDSQASTDSSDYDEDFVNRGANNYVKIKTPIIIFELECIK
jgi:hypothetical protein